MIAIFTTCTDLDAAVIHLGRVPVGSAAATRSALATGA
jgi:hypothetical protein